MAEFKIVFLSVWSRGGAFEDLSDGAVPKAAITGKRTATDVDGSKRAKRRARNAEERAVEADSAEEEESAEDRSSGEADGE